MNRLSYHSRRARTRQGREATVADVVETVDLLAPETKAELASEVGISEQYLSEIVQELKRDGVLKKGYVVDDAALYDRIEEVSALAPSGGGRRAQRQQQLLTMLERVDELSRKQYDDCRAAFETEGTGERARQLEAVTNERHAAMFDELKSYMLATEWPGNRMASDLATMATNLELVGDRACFIADVIENQQTAPTGILAERVLDIFEAGERVHDCMRAIIFEADVERYDSLRTEEERIHRDLDELFELVTAYDPEMYGYLVSITRALERAIFYWSDTAELAVRLHSGRAPDHITMSSY